MSERLAGGRLNGAPLRRPPALLLVWAGLLVAGVLGGLAVEGNRIDGRIVRDVAAERSPTLTSFARVVTGVGDSTSILVASAAVVAFLLARRRPRDALVVVLATAGATLLTDAIKLIVERPRPPGGGLVAVASSDWPSGHAATTAACFGALAALAPPRAAAPAALAATLVAGAVGASRVYLGVHYPSDVIAGWALGGAWLGAVVILLRRRPPRAARSRPPPRATAPRPEEPRV